MYDIRVATELIRSTADEILSQVDALPKDCIHWKPGPEVWTVMDNLCHISEFVPYWTAQIEQVIEQPKREWGRTHHDAARLAAVANTGSHTLSDAQKQLAAVVSQSTCSLEKYSPAQFETQAPSRNPRWGVKPASFIVDTLLVTHLQNHLAQIRRNYTQFQHLQR